jgi:hypothetical protein
MAFSFARSALCVPGCVVGLGRENWAPKWAARVVRSIVVAHPDLTAMWVFCSIKTTTGSEQTLMPTISLLLTPSSHALHCNDGRPSAEKGRRRHHGPFRQRARPPMGGCTAVEWLLGGTLPACTLKDPGAAVCFSCWWPDGLSSTASPTRCPV